MQDIATAPKVAKERKKQYTVQQIIDALTKSKGMVYLAAKALDCDPSTIHRRANTNKQIRAAIEASRGEVLDVAEVALMAAIQRQEAWAIAFALKTIGKGRGYVERVQQEVGPVGGWREEAKALGIDPDKVEGAVTKLINGGHDDQT